MTISDEQRLAASYAVQFQTASNNLQTALNIQADLLVAETILGPEQARELLKACSGNLQLARRGADLVAAGVPFREVLLAVEKGSPLPPPEVLLAFRGLNEEAGKVEAAFASLIQQVGRRLAGEQSWRFHQRTWLMQHPEHTRYRARRVRALTAVVRRDPELHTCGTEIQRSDKHDAKYCDTCDVWLEGACSDPECWYCPGRPERPSMVQEDDHQPQEPEGSGQS